MRYPIDHTGDDQAPTGRAGQAIRIFSLLAVGVTFLALTKSFTNGPASTTPTTGGSGPVAVYAPAALRELLPNLNPSGRYTFGEAAELAGRIDDGAEADVFISDDPVVIQTLADGDRCTAPVTVATGTPTSPPGSSPDAPAGASAAVRYRYCLVNRAGTNRAGAAAFAATLTGITGREALLSRGFDVPDQRPSAVATTG